jgi:hypothetical protein
MMAGVDEQEAGVYRKAWRGYVRRRNFIAVVFIGFIPWGFLVFKFIPNEIVRGILLWAWFLTWLVGIVWYVQQKCPRCGKRFASTLWGQRCAHCGLSRPQIAVTTGAKTSFV